MSALGACGLAFDWQLGTSCGRGWSARRGSSLSPTSEGSAEPISTVCDTLHLSSFDMCDILDVMQIDEAASGRARSNRNLVPGGKSLSGTPGQHSPVVNVRVPQHVREGLGVVAGGDAVSKVARQALDGAQQHYVVWQQSFGGGSPEWVRFDKPMTLEAARELFNQFKRSALAHGWLRLEIRRGRDLVIESWPGPSRPRP